MYRGTGRDLEEGRAQSGGLDEREQQALGSSFGFGAVLMALLCVALAAAGLLRGGQAYDLAAAVPAYLAGAQAHSYWKSAAGLPWGLRRPMTWRRQPI